MTTPNEIEKPDWFTPRRAWTLWGVGNLAFSAFMVTGISESFLGGVNAIFAGTFGVAGVWLLYCAYHMESGPHD